MVLKKILLLIAICSFLFILGSCGEDFYPMMEKESFKFCPIETTVNDINSFITDIKTYASTIEKDLTLGAIQLIIDQNFEYKVKFEFSKSESNRAMLVNLTYNPVNKGIEYTQRIAGPSKLCSSFVEPLDYSHWEINFEEGVQRLQEEMLDKEIQIFDQIICTCYAKTWTYRGYTEKDDPSSNVFIITVKP